MNVVACSALMASCEQSGAWARAPHACMKRPIMWVGNYIDHAGCFRVSKSGYTAFATCSSSEYSRTCTAEYSATVLPLFKTRGRG